MNEVKTYYRPTMEWGAEWEVDASLEDMVLLDDYKSLQAIIEKANGLLRRWMTHWGSTMRNAMEKDTEKYFSEIQSSPNESIEHEQQENAEEHVKRPPVYENMNPQQVHDICKWMYDMEIRFTESRAQEQRLRDALEGMHEWFNIAMCPACGAVSMAYAEECGKDPYHDHAIALCKAARAALTTDAPTEDDGKDRAAINYARSHCQYCDGPLDDRDRCYNCRKQN